MLTGIIPTGKNHLDAYPVPVELIPAGSFYDAGRKVKPLIYDVIQRLVLAGCERIVIGINTRSNLIAQYCRNGQDQFSIPILYSWTESGESIPVINDVFSWVEHDTLAIADGEWVYEPPYLFQRVIDHMKAKQADAVIGNLAGGAFVTVINSKATGVIRDMTTEGKVRQLCDTLDMAKTKGLKVSRFEIGGGRATRGLLDKEPVWLGS